MMSDAKNDFVGVCVSKKGINKKYITNAKKASAAETIPKTAMFSIKEYK